MTQVKAGGERVHQKPPRLRLQLKVKVLWVEVVNPDVSVLSSAAVAASMTKAAEPTSMLAKAHVPRETIYWRFQAPTSCRRGETQRS